MLGALRPLFRALQRSDETPVISDVARFVQLHDEGLKRVLCVIDGAPNYDKIIAERLKPERVEAFAALSSLADRQAMAIKMAHKALARPARRLLQPTFSGFASDGKTSNNIREFRFLDSACAQLNLNTSVQNYTINGRQRRAPRLDSSELDVIDQIRLQLASFYSARPEVSVALVQQQINYSTNFVAKMRAFCAKDAVLPCAFVLANDHWPSLVAGSMVMKALGIPRLYLQHAEVSKVFPPLDFEISILRNNRSLQTYQEIGAAEGETFVIGRALPADDFRKSLSRERLNLMPVVIYPTARIVDAALISMVQSLLENKNVSEVIIKRHPRSLPFDFGKTDAQIVRVVDDIPTKDHIAVVGNSSIALELLAKGIPVYQNFDFDPVGQDYYGFVSDGITQSVSIDAFEGKFWTPYDLNSSWSRSFENWFPSRAENEKNLSALWVKLSKIITA